jgi:hypothetical protein
MRKMLILFLGVCKAWGLDYAYEFGGILRDFGTQVRVDNRGNVFVACSLYLYDYIYHAGAVGKMSPTGKLEWLRLIGGPDSASALHRPQIAVSPLGDGSLYVAGYYSEGPTRGFKVAKLDANGDVIWATWLYNDRATFYYARFPAIAVLPDGDCMVMWSTARPDGSNNYDLLFARFSGSDGQMKWFRVYDYYEDDGYYSWLGPFWYHATGMKDTTVIFNNLVLLPNQHIISVSVRMDRNGNIIGSPWAPSGSIKWMLSMDTLPGEDIVSLWYTGRGSNLSEPETLYIVRTSGDWSATRWARLRLGPDTVYGAFYIRPYMGIAGTLDTGCVVVGICSEVPYTSSWLITKLSSSGVSEWHRTEIALPGRKNFLTSVAQTPDGDYVTVGTIVSTLEDDAVVMRLNTDGSTCITRDTNITLSSVSFHMAPFYSFTEVTSLYEGHIFAVQTPTLTTVPSYMDTILCPALPVYDDPSVALDDPIKMWLGSGGRLYLIASSEMDISLALYDISGRLASKVYEGIIPAGKHTFLPDIRRGGSYVAVLRYQGKVKTMSLVR